MSRKEITRKLAEYGNCYRASASMVFCPTGATLITLTVSVPVYDAVYDRIGQVFKQSSRLVMDTRKAISSVVQLAMQITKMMMQYLANCPANWGWTEEKIVNAQRYLGQAIADELKRYLNVK